MGQRACVSTGIACISGWHESTDNNSVVPDLAQPPITIGSNRGMHRLLNKYLLSIITPQQLFNQPKAETLTHYLATVTSRHGFYTTNPGLSFHGPRTTASIKRIFLSMHHFSEESLPGSCYPLPLLAHTPIALTGFSTPAIQLHLNRSLIVP